jgi:hypothetical protein
MLNTIETVERLDQLNAYRMELVRKLSSDFLSAQEYITTKDTISQVDAIRNDLISHLELLRRPINY